jgi:hypothetical protein
MAGVPYTSLTPLTLSLSPWERGRMLQASFRGAFSQGEKDRMRGATPAFCAPRRIIP